MIQIRKGDVLNIREEDPLNAKETVVNTYEVVDIPRHHRFITCVLMKDDAKTAITKTFSQLDLKENLAWGGIKIKLPEKAKEAVKRAGNEKPFEQWTNDELRAYCKRNKVRGYRNMRKAEIKELVRQDMAKIGGNV